VQTYDVGWVLHEIAPIERETLATLLRALGGLCGIAASRRAFSTSVSCFPSPRSIGTPPCKSCRRSSVSHIFHGNSDRTRSRVRPMIGSSTYCKGHWRPGMSSAGPCRVPAASGICFQMRLDPPCKSCARARRPAGARTDRRRQSACDVNELRPRTGDSARPGARDRGAGEPGPTRRSRSDSDFRGDVWESALAAVTILA
jgi:hypothetical protein